MDDRPLEERLQAADMDYLTFRSISIGFIVDVTPVLGGMMVGGKVLDHWLVNLLSLDIFLDRILLNLCWLSTFVLPCSIRDCSVLVIKSGFLKIHLTNDPKRLVGERGSYGISPLSPTSRIEAYPPTSLPCSYRAGQERHSLKLINSFYKLENRRCKSIQIDRGVPNQQQALSRPF